MKKTKMIFFKTITFLFLFSLISCSEDLYEENTNSEKHSILVQRKNFEDLKKNKKLMKSIEKFTLKSSSSLQRQHYDSINNFFIDLDNVMFTLDSLQNQTYTFKINRIPDNGLFENLILKTSRTGDFDAILSQYNQNSLNLHSNNPQEILNSINQNVTFTYLGKKSISEINSKLIYNDECYEPGYVYVTGNSCASGQHTFADGASCTYWGTTDMATSGGYVYTMISVSCDGDGGGSDGLGGDFSTGPHGGGGSSTPIANPCNKVKNQNTKFPSLKQSLVNLATTTSQNYENGIFIDNTATATTVNPVQTIPSNTANGGTIPLNMNPTNSYVMLAHTHDSYGSDGTGTYSIFSWDDLTTINNLIKNNHIDNSNFVFYVITADGTRYALTVDSASDLSNFFYDPSNLPFGTQIDAQKMLEMQRIFEKYYDKSKNGLITTTSIANNDKTNFLKFIKEANLGITLFEVDATFTTYQKLSISNSGVVTPTPCN